MPDFDIDELARRYAAGESTKDIGDSIGVPFSTVRHWLVRHGVRMRSASESVRLAAGVTIDVDDVAKRYAAGESANTIAKSLGVSCGVVMDRLLSHGVILRDRKSAHRLSAIKPIGPDTVISRYATGESAQSLAREFGVTSPVIYRVLREAGVTARGPAEAGKNRRVAVDSRELIDLYRAGNSELALSLKFGISRPTVRRRLLEAGIEPRGGSEANLIRMARMSPEDRLALAEKAHAAVRGVPKSEELLCQSALTRQMRPVNVSPAETTFAGWIRGKGIEVVQQKAVGRYNVDIALTETRIAVEIFGGHWHATGRHAERFRHRFDYLIDAGWTPVIIWVTQGWPLGDGALDYVVTLHEILRSGEACGGKEHVIRGDGDIGTVGKSKPHNGAIIMGFNPGNPSRGEDGRFR